MAEVWVSNIFKHRARMLILFVLITSGMINGYGGATDIPARHAMAASLERTEVTSARERNDQAGQTPARAPALTRNVIANDFLGAAALRAVDLDKDSDFDLIGAAYQQDEIAWWENDGDGNFTKHEVATNFNWAISVEAADFNNDGHMDIVAAGLEQNEIAWWENNGSEIFYKRTIANDFSGARDVYPVDLDQDGKIDVLAGAYYAEELAWWKNDGAGNFTKHLIAVGWGPWSVYAADVNKDTHPDLIANDYPFRVGWWAGNGLGAFSEGQVIAETYVGVNSVSAGDMNQDGLIDILASSSADDDALYFLNTNILPLLFTSGMYTIGTGIDGAFDVQPYDMDNDGDMDAIVAGRFDGQVLWYENVGLLFTFPKHVVDSSFLGAMAVTAADFNGDGITDMAAAAAESNSVAWWAFSSDMNPPAAVTDLAAQDGRLVGSVLLRWTAPGDDSTVGTAANYIVRYSHTPILAQADWLAAIDVSGEPAPLLAGSSQQMLLSGLQPGENYYFAIRTQDELLNLADISNSPNSMPTPERFDPKPDATSALAPNRITVGDMNGDLQVDMLIYDKLAWELYWLESSGAGIFTKHSIGVPVHELEDLSLADLDQDGDVDIAASSWYTSEGNIQWWENLGNEEFQLHPLDYGFSGVGNIVTVDLDQDGKIDILGTSFDSNQIAWWKNEGEDGFTRSTLIPAVEAVNFVQAGDYDLDGDLDLVTSAATYSGTRLCWWENLGEELFSVHELDNALFAPSSIFAIDFEPDGDVDFLATAYYSNTVLIFENIGSMEFTRHAVTETLPGASFAQAADMDSDGDLDVLSASDTTNTLSIWDNLGDWQFHEFVISNQYQGARQIFAVNLDGMGNLDVAAAGRLTQNGPIWWRNRSGMARIYLPLVTR